MEEQIRNDGSVALLEIVAGEELSMLSGSNMIWRKGGRTNQK